MSDLNEVDARQRAEASETMLSYFETSNWLEFWEKHLRGMQKRTIESAT